MLNPVRRIRRMEQEYPNKRNDAIRLLNKRLGNTDLPTYTPDTVDGANLIAHRLIEHGGLPQQDRMIKDKRHSLDMATKYSYQAALVKKVRPIVQVDPRLLMDDEVPHGPWPPEPVRALINPDKNKVDYDDKIISIGFEHNYKPGDVFEWCNTHSFWLVYLQDLDELAYFRGEIRRCDHQIEWLDENGKKFKTYAAVRGPVETKIDYIQKHGVSIDKPNLSLHILIPRNEKTMHQFKRYSKFYLGTADDPDRKICWRVEATDSISTVGILEFTAVEYYSNEFEDDVEAGLVGALIKPIEEPEVDKTTEIQGPVFIKPKVETTYFIEDKSAAGSWFLGKTPAPVRIEPFTTLQGYPAVKVKWGGAYSGQFDLFFGTSKEAPQHQKTIVVESLF